MNVQSMCNDDDHQGAGGEGEQHYVATCQHCGHQLFSSSNIGDVQVETMLMHLWSSHSQLVRRPQTLPLAELAATFGITVKLK